MSSIFLQNMFRYLDDAIDVFSVDSRVGGILKDPDKVLSAKLRIRADSEEMAFPAWRVQNNNSGGPYKGGIRFHEDVTREECEALALGMSLKTALYGLPFGGAKGGVQVDPRGLSKNVLQEISRSYIRAFYNDIGPYVDIPAPDLNTNSQVMAWMMDEYSGLRGRNEPGSVTGKPVELGGSELREEATAYGGYFALKEALKAIGWEKEYGETTVAIQGFGNVGRNIAKLLYDDGFHIAALSDHSGAVRDNGNGKGLDPREIEEMIRESGLISGSYLPGIQNEEWGMSISRDDLLSLDADILIPSAAENQIHENNAGDIKASIIVEMANGPTTHKAEKLLLERGAYILPDILANGGGVVVSYFEWVQDLERFFWTRDTVLERLHEVVRRVFAQVDEEARAQKTDMRMAAYGVALKHLERTMKLRGKI